MRVTGRLALPPRPASRPQFTCRGRFAVAYNDPKYKAWLADATELLALQPIPEGWDKDAPFAVRLRFNVLKPRTSKLLYPKPDIDNYEKSFLDAVTKVGTIWADDSQVIALPTAKRFVLDEADEGILFNIRPLRI